MITQNNNTEWVPENECFKEYVANLNKKTLIETAREKSLNNQRFEKKNASRHLTKSSEVLHLCAFGREDVRTSDTSRLPSSAYDALTPSEGFAHRLKGSESSEWACGFSEFAERQYGAVDAEVLQQAASDSYLARDAGRRYVGWCVRNERRRGKKDWLVESVKRMFENIRSTGMEPTLECREFARFVDRGIEYRVQTGMSQVLPTVFLNPDGKRYSCKRADYPMRGKQAYEAKHDIPDDYKVSVTVVGSSNRDIHAVVGLERKKDAIASSYYDPTPSYEDVWDRDTDTVVSRYRWVDSTLLVVPQDGQFTGHRLTVMEYEHAVLAGAFDEPDPFAIPGHSFCDADMAFDDELPDYEAGYEFAEFGTHDPRGYAPEGNRVRTVESLCWDEQELYSILMSLGYVEEAGRVVQLENELGKPESPITQQIAREVLGEWIIRGNDYKAFGAFLTRHIEYHAFTPEEAEKRSKSKQGHQKEADYTFGV